MELNVPVELSYPICMSRTPQRYGKRTRRSRPRNARQSAGARTTPGPDHPSRTLLARWFNRTCTQSEKQEIERHFLFCRVCQRRITLKELTDVAVEAKKRLKAALRSAERN